jgi:FkbM family methyltransferase
MARDSVDSQIRAQGQWAVELLARETHIATAKKRLLLKIMATLGSSLRRTPLVRLKWLGRLHANLAVRVSNSNSVTVGPFRVFVDRRNRVIAKHLILYGGYEAREIALLCSYVKPGDCVLDVGANIGLYSLALSRAVGPSGRVIAVEPDPDNLALLRKNLQANGCTNVTVIEDALGDESKDALLYESSDNRGALSTSDITGVGASRAIRVRMRRGDDVMAEIGLSARVAKIDVEGVEPLVTILRSSYRVSKVAAIHWPVWIPIPAIAAP